MSVLEGIDGPEDLRGLSEQELADIYAYLLSIPPLVDPKATAILDH